MPPLGATFAEQVRMSAQRDAGQMFEPKMADAARRRELQRKHDLSSPGADPARQPGNDGGEVPADAPLEGVNQRPQEHSDPPAVVERHEEPAYERPVSDQTDGLRKTHADSHQQRGGAAGHRPAAHASDVAAVRPDGQAVRAVATEANPLVASPAITQRSEAPPSPAQQIGRILAAARADGSDTSRSSAHAGNSAAEHARMPRAKQDEAKAPTRTANKDGSTAAAKGTMESRGSPRTEFDQLVRSIRLSLGTRRSSARMRLEPPELGRIRVDVQIDGQNVRLGIQTETQAARRLIAERAEQLKDSLAEHGIRVERFEVVLNTADPTTAEREPNVNASAVMDGKAGAWNGSSESGGRSPARGRELEEETSVGLTPAAEPAAARPGWLDIRA